MCPDAHAHTHGLKGSASHPFTSEQREWTFNSNITKAPSHLGSKSVLISPDHTQCYLISYISYIWQSQSPHLICFKNHTGLIIYSQYAHVFQTQKTDFSFWLFSLVFFNQIFSLLTAISYAILLDKSLRQGTSKAIDLLGAPGILL